MAGASKKRGKTVADLYVYRRDVHSGRWIVVYRLRVKVGRRKAVQTPTAPSSIWQWFEGLVRGDTAGVNGNHRIGR